MRKPELQFNIGREVQSYLRWDSKIPSYEQNQFYQAKYESYRLMMLFAVVAAACVAAFYWFMDCEQVGFVDWRTFGIRLSNLLMIPIMLFLVVHVRNYRMTLFFAYVTMHYAVWSSCIAIMMTPDKTYLPIVFIIIHFAFMAIGMAAPWLFHMYLHVLYLADLAILNTVYHVRNFGEILILSIPVFIGISLALKILESSFEKEYISLQKLEIMSVTDSLTGLYNRNKLNTLLDRNTTRLRGKLPQAILMLDIDHFKLVNDTYGHDKGDEVLQYVTRKIQDIIRRHDIAIRYGGEEFVVILFDTDESGAYQTAERIRTQIQNSADGPIDKLTISIGVYEYAGEDIEDAIKKADRALYKAKERRNRTICYSKV